MCAQDLGLQLEASTQGRNRANRIAAILTASKVIFVEDGYAAFAARRVAATVGLTLSNLQYYFPTREALLKATVEWVLDGYLKTYRTLARGPASAQRRFNALLDQIFANIHEPNVPAFMFEAWALRHHDAGIASVIDRVYAEYRQIIAGLLLEINPSLAERECLIRATVLAAQTEGLIIFAFRGGDTDRDNSEVIRTMKRTARLLAHLPARAAPESVASPGSEWTAGQTIGDLHRAPEDSASRPPESRLELTFPNTAVTTSLYSRPTKQSLRRAEKMREIVTVAADVLSLEGYGNFTQARIAKLAGILPSNLQHYFPTHDGLLHATLHALMTTYLDRYSAMSHATGKLPSVRLDEIIGDVLDEIRDRQVVRFSFEMFALAQRVPVASELLIRVYRAYREIFISLVHEIDAEANSRECYARATLIAATVEGLMLYAGDSGTSTPYIRYIDALVRAFSFLIAQGGTEVGAS